MSTDARLFSATPADFERPTTIRLADRFVPHGPQFHEPGLNRISMPVCAADMRIMKQFRHQPQPKMGMGLHLFLHCFMRS